MGSPPVNQPLNPAKIANAHCKREKYLWILILDGRCPNTTQWIFNDLFFAINGLRQPPCIKLKWRLLQASMLKFFLFLFLNFLLKRKWKAIHCIETRHSHNGKFQGGRGEQGEPESRYQLTSWLQGGAKFHLTFLLILVQKTFFLDQTESKERKMFWLCSGGAVLSVVRVLAHSIRP
jgi:hypothetical protein